jgi:hypothetical protein
MNSTKLSCQKNAKFQFKNKLKKKKKGKPKKSPEVASRHLEEQIALYFFLFSIKSILKKTVRNS